MGVLPLGRGSATIRAMFSTFGHLFRATTFGESHGSGVGVVVDGCPSGLPFRLESVQAALNRRRPGQSRFTTPRDESDTVSVLSGVQDGVTLGTPIALVVPNQDQRPGDYATMDPAPRPSHADYTYLAKYGVKARSGGGRASARETIGRVAAGAVAEQLLASLGVRVVAWVGSVGGVDARVGDPCAVTRAQVDASPVRCPDPESARKIESEIEAALADNDSVGGVVTCCCQGLPPGWGEPVFGKLDALLAQAMLSLPACKGFEIGEGFRAARCRGSAMNDLFMPGEGGRLSTRTNHSGGVQGGISNGQPVLFRAAFKPAATIGRPQDTVDYEGRAFRLECKGRHDPCVLPRAVPIVEAMAQLVLADVALLHRRLGADGVQP